VESGHGVLLEVAGQRIVFILQVNILRKEGGIAIFF